MIAKPHSGILFSHSAYKFLLQVDSDHNKDKWGFVSRLHFADSHGTIVPRVVHTRHNWVDKTNQVPSKRDDKSGRPNGLS
jgi:hypothetical protein